MGATIDEIDTPALLVELDAFEHNLRKLADFAANSGVRLRPHAKTHKCPEIARRQMALSQQARLLNATQAIFRHWHAAHRPVAITAFIAVTIHVVVVIAVVAVAAAGLAPAPTRRRD